MSQPREAIDGVLIVDKPAGPTSHDVVAAVKKSLNAKKAGHTGTLDPFATGVLPVCLGRATKLAQWLTGADKSYEATAVFGVETDSQDGTGEIVSRSGAGDLTEAALRQACVEFRGAIEQVPPMHSAVKVDGTRLYEHARRGEEVAREARPVRIDELELVEFSAPAPDPDLGAVVARGTFRVRCSKGTYIRTLLADVGRRTGSGAFVESLRRTGSGDFVADAAVPLAEVKSDPAAARARMLELDAVPLPMPSVAVDDDAARKVGHGVPPELDAAPGFVAVRDGANRLLAIAEVLASGRVKIARGI